MILTAEEAAEKSRRCRETIYRHIRRYQATKHLRHPKGLKATRPEGGLQWKIQESDFEKWLEGK